MKFIVVLLIILDIFCFANDKNLIEYDYELDAYYSNISAFINLDSDANITDATKYSEAQIYKELALNTFNPNIFLLEAAVHPMGIAGSYFRQNDETMYDKSKFHNFNWVKALSTGFEEPYSISFFIGRMMIFKNKKDDHIGKNRAYMGYLLSIGDYTIKDNIAHYDRWFTAEYKLKGTRELENSDLDWSFRVGATVHENKNFVNNIYIGARRSSIDYKQKILSFLYNSDFNSMIAVSADNFYLTQASFSVGKAYPISSTKISFGLEIGYEYNSGEKYRGALKEEGIENHLLILHPNFKF